MQALIDAAKSQLLSNRSRLHSLCARSGLQPREDPETLQSFQQALSEWDAQVAVQNSGACAWGVATARVCMGTRATHRPMHAAWRLAAQTGETVRRAVQRAHTCTLHTYTHCPQASHTCKYPYVHDAPSLVRCHLLAELLEQPAYMSRDELNSALAGTMLSRR